MLVDVSEHIKGAYWPPSGIIVALVSQLLEPSAAIEQQLVLLANQRPSAALYCNLGNLLRRAGTLRCLGHCSRASESACIVTHQAGTI